MSEVPSAARRGAAPASYPSVCVAASLGDITALIDARPLSALQLLVAMLCGVAMFADGYDLQALALAVPSIAQQWQVPATRFGLALAAATVGLAAGGILLAPLGDRIGRKPALIAALAMIGLSSLLTITAATPTQFALWRLLTGLGLGFGVPNCNAWTAEYAPARSRALILVLMNAAISAGAFLSAFIAPWVIAAFGWQGTFVVGGTLPLLLALALLFAPESVKFLAARRPADPRIGAILARIVPGGAWQAASGAAPPPAARSKQGYVAAAKAAAVLPAALLVPEYRARTLLLWLVTVLNLFVLFLLLNWLPTLLQSAGLTVAAALRGTALIQLGGLIGGITLSRFIDRGYTLPALRVAFGLAALCLGGFLGLPAGGTWNALLLLVGIGVSGAQLGLNALSTAYYPPAIKATGMSWVGAIGQAGAFVAPLTGAWLIQQQVPPTHILALMALPALACVAVALFMRQSWQAH